MNQGIYYLYEYETGQRKRNLGFLQISHQYRSCMMTLHLKSLPLSPGTALHFKLMVCLEIKEKRTEGADLRGEKEER